MPWVSSASKISPASSLSAVYRDALEISRPLGRGCVLQIGHDVDPPAEQRIHASGGFGDDLCERRLVGRTLELDSHRARIAGRLGQIGRRRPNHERPEHVGADVGDDPSRGFAGGLGGGGRAEPAAVKRDAQIAVARHHGLSQVRFSGAHRAVEAEKKQPVAGRGAEREDGLTRLDVDEDLVPGGRSQSRATLAERIRHAHQSHCVDGVGRERPVRGMGRVDPGERVACGVRVPPSVRAERVRQVVVRVQARSGAPVLLELDKHRLLQHPSEAREVGMERRGHHRLAVSERERGELPKDDVVRDAERVDGTDRADPRDDRAAALPEPGQHVVHRTRERHLRRIDRVGATAFAASDRSSPRRGCRRSRPREP